MTENSFTPTQRWLGWIFGGLMAYLIQGVMWSIFGLIYAIWKELWGGGLVQGADDSALGNIPLLSSLINIIGSTMLYSAIGFIFAGLVHMLAYSIPGAIFLCCIRPNSLLIRQLWLALFVGWCLGATAMGYHYYGEAGWIWSATIFGGFYGILTASTCWILIKRKLL